MEAQYVIMRANITPVKKLTDDELMQKIINTTAEHCGIPVKVMLSRWRKREVVVARQQAMKLGRMFTKLPLGSIGYALGTEHSNCIHACQTVDDLIETDKKFRESFLVLTGKIKMYC